MDAIWNSRSVLPPPTVTLPEDLKKATSDEITLIKAVLSGAIHFLNEETMLGSEQELISTIIYRDKNKLRKEKAFQGLTKINKCLKRLLELNLADLLQEFSSCLPSDEVLVQLGQAFLPSRPMLQYVLVRLLGSVHLLSQIEEFCQQTHIHTLQVLQLGTFIPDMLVFGGTVSRIWILCRSLQSHVMLWYSQLYALLKLLKDTQACWLPPGFALPADLTKWLVELGFDSRDGETTVFINEDKANDPMTSGLKEGHPLPCATSGQLSLYTKEDDSHTLRQNAIVLENIEDVGNPICRNSVKSEIVEDTGYHISPKSVKLETNEEFRYPSIQQSTSMESIEDGRDPVGNMSVKEENGENNGKHISQAGVTEHMKEDRDFTSRIVTRRLAKTGEKHFKRIEKLQDSVGQTVAGEKSARIPPTGRDFTLKKTKKDKQITSGEEQHSVGSIDLTHWQQMVNNSSGFEELFHIVRNFGKETGLGIIWRSMPRLRKLKKSYTASAHFERRDVMLNRAKKYLAEYLGKVARREIVVVRDGTKKRKKKKKNKTVSAEEQGQTEKLSMQKKKKTVLVEDQIEDQNLPKKKKKNRKTNISENDLDRNLPTKKRKKRKTNTSEKDLDRNLPTKKKKRGMNISEDQTEEQNLCTKKQMKRKMNIYEDQIENQNIYAKKQKKGKTNISEEAIYVSDSGKLGANNTKKSKKKSGIPGKRRYFNSKTPQPDETQIMKKQTFQQGANFDQNVERQAKLVKLEFGVSLPEFIPLNRSKENASRNKNKKKLKRKAAQKSKRQ